MKCCNHIFTGTLWKKCVKLVQNLNNILVGLTFGLTAICQGESVKLCKFTTFNHKTSQIYYCRSNQNPQNKLNLLLFLKFGLTLKRYKYLHISRGECEIEKWRKFTSDSINYSVDNGKLLG